MKKFDNKHVKKAKRKYYHDYFVKYQHNSRKQWQMINSLLNRNLKKSSVTKFIDKNGYVTSTTKEIAEKFNEYFCTIVSKLKPIAYDSDKTQDHCKFLPPSVVNTIYETETNHKANYKNKYKNNVKNIYKTNNKTSYKTNYKTNYIN